MSEDEAFEAFKAIRWASNAGKPFCVRCGCVAVYSYKARRIFKCKGCNAQFSVTTGTIFASRKLPLRDILAAIAIFVNGAKGHSALQLSRDLDVQYKTAFVLSHKIREAMAREQGRNEIGGVVEIDGAYFGGYVKPANYKENRRDRRLWRNQSGKREVVVVMRERKGEIRRRQRRRRRSRGQRPRHAKRPLPQTKPPLTHQRRTHRRKTSCSRHPRRQRQKTP